MTTQRIILGDCLDVFANERDVPAFVSDPPANIAFMGRSWDKANPALDYVPLIPARDKAHLRELQREHAFIKYWAQRYAMAYDIADQHATNIVWTLPRTSYQTATALRAAGWDIKDNLVHLFGSGWAKTGNALAPGQEGWLLATKGKPDLDIDACRVPRGGEDLARENPGNTPLSWGGTFGHGPNTAQTRKVQGLPPLGSLPKNALLSHCEECVRVGCKTVKGANRTGPNGGTKQSGGVAYNVKNGVAPGHALAGNYTTEDGTESVQAWHCLAGCVCGARSKWDPERPLPQCPCGETWQWICPVAEVNGQSGDLPGRGNKKPSFGGGGSFGLPRQENPFVTFGDQGGASRFFSTFSYLSKCSSSERHAGCENLFWRANKKNPFGFDQVTREEWEQLASDERGQGKKTHGQTTDHGARDNTRAQGNVHPTVKSYRLMHWLHSLTGAKRILDFTAGSGTGMYTAFLDGIDWLGAEICPEAITIAEARLAFWKGLTTQARDAFMRDDIVTAALAQDERQRSLF